MINRYLIVINKLILTQSKQISFLLLSQIDVILNFTADIYIYIYIYKVQLANLENHAVMFNPLVPSVAVW